MTTIHLYDRWQYIFPAESGIDRVVFTASDGTAVARPVFRHQPVTLRYDDHGYEHLVADGDEVLAVRFTPTNIGECQWQAMAGGDIWQEGSFECIESDEHGFVEISQHDPRYFAFSDGAPYTAIGLNLVGPPSYALAAGGEFAQSQQTGTLGVQEYARWFARLAENGGNYARLWLSHPYFNVDGENAGDINLTAFAKLDEVISLARRYGIKLKMCLEHFRHVAESKEPAIFTHKKRDPDTGEYAANMDEWFQSERWQQLWWQKIDAYLARYDDDPVVMAWELWNEIDCCGTSNWSIQRDWTEKTLTQIKTLSPRNLATNSLGSFDWDGKQPLQDDFKMDEMDFQQVHRYLDQGAGFEICKHDPVAFSIDGVFRGRRADRPVILTETGAVNDSHTGPFRYYRWDDDGLIFHDTTYPAFFAGAAGSGHIWHWDQYVDQKNLWKGLKALGQVIEGVAIDREYFHAFDLSTDKYWCLVLKGCTTTLGWLRNKSDNWDRVLRDGKSPIPVHALVDFKKINVSVNKMKIFHPWENDGIGDVDIKGNIASFPEFIHGVVFRIIESKTAFMTGTAGILPAPGCNSMARNKR
ncbi:MAG: hypothetical protein WCO98_02740 [bacterium]